MTEPRYSRDVARHLRRLVELMQAHPFDEWSLGLLTVVVTAIDIELIHPGPLASGPNNRQQDFYNLIKRLQGYAYDHPPSKWSPSLLLVIVNMIDLDFRRTTAQPPPRRLTIVR